jgi:hypothetical protein
MTAPGTTALQEDLPCIHCRYNLRGLSEDGICPECGNPVAPSVEKYRRTADPLDQVDPRWVARMGGAFFLLALSGIWAAAAPSVDHLARNLYSEYPRDQVHGIRLALYVLPWAIAFVASWRIASREPHASTVDRRYLRWTIRSTAALWLLAPVLITGPWGFRAQRDWFPLLIAAAPASFLLFVRAAKLMARADRPRLTVECLVLGVVTGGGIALQVLLLGDAYIRRASADEVLFAAPMLATGYPTLSSVVPDVVSDMMREEQFTSWALLFMGWALLLVWAATALIRTGHALRTAARASRHVSL